jgi:hypothetical protein
MKKALALTTALLIFALASYVLSNPRKPSTVVFALGGIESCDSDGNTVDEFNPGDPVYVKGSGLELGGLYNIYIVQDYSSWSASETHISDLDVVVGPIAVDVDVYGNIENQTVLIWESASPGLYDIWADSQTDGEIGYYDECDAVDKLGVEETGFIVIPEMLLITIPLLFAYITIITLKQKRNNANKN